MGMVHFAGVTPANRILTKCLELVMLNGSFVLVNGSTLIQSIQRFKIMDIIIVYKKRLEVG